MSTYSQYESKNISLLSRIGDGRSYGLLIEDDIAYMGSGCYLYIVDVSDKAAPRLISKTLTDDVMYDIKKQHDYLYISNVQAGLAIFDVSSPNSPINVGNCKTKWATFKLTLQNNYAFMSCFAHGFIVVDISDVANPFEVANYETEGSGEGLDVKGDRLYFCDNYAGLKVFDISDPSNPTLLSKYTNLKSAESILFYDDYDIVLSQYDTLHVLNTNDLDNIVEVAQLQVFSSGRSLSRIQDTLYVAGQYSEVYAINIGDIINPNIVSKYKIDAYTQDVRIVGNELYVLDINEGLEIYEKNEEKNLISAFPMPSYMREFDFYNDYLTIAYQHDGVRLYDIKNPTEPKFITNLIGEDYPHQILNNRVSNVINVDNISFMLTEDNGVHLVDITDPSNPDFLSLLLNEDGRTFSGSGIAKVNDDIYYILGEGGIMIYDLGDPKSPIFLKSIFFNYPQRILVQNGYAYTTNYNLLADEYKISILDIKDVLNPTLVGETTLPYHPYGIDIYNDYLFAACHTGGLNIIDVRDKTAPILKERIYDNHYMFYVFINDNYAYVSDSHHGLEIFDISDMENIREVGRIDLNANAYFVKGYKDIIYVSTFNTGLFILKNDLITSIVENDSEQLSTSISLFQNYPNPFNPSSTIQFEIEKQEHVLLDVYNMIGEKITTLVNKVLVPGKHEVKFDGAKFPSGNYIYRIITSRNNLSRTMTLTK